MVLKCVGRKIQDGLGGLKEASWLLWETVCCAALVAQHLLCFSADSLVSRCSSINLKFLGALVLLRKIPSRFVRRAQAAHLIRYTVE